VIYPVDRVIQPLNNLGQKQAKLHTVCRDMALVVPSATHLKVTKRNGGPGGENKTWHEAMSKACELVNQKANLGASKAKRRYDRRVCGLVLKPGVLVRRS